jgi:TfoX/Sxy family transcriptional regulator of competence genes
MPYNFELADRIRAELSGTGQVDEKKMFGGVGFMVQGNMACGVIGVNLVVRIGAENSEAALAHPYTRPFDFSGKPMAGWVYVEPAGVVADSNLRGWIAQGVAFAQSLPAK